MTPQVQASAPAPADAAVLTRNDAVWTRVFKEKAAGVSIPVSLPVARVPDPAISARIAALLTPEALLGSSRAQAESDGWLDRVSWTSGYNRAGLLDLAVLIEGSGPYPSQAVKHVVLDLHTGAALGAASFSAAKRAALVAKLDATLQARVLGAVKADPDVANILGDRHVTEAQLAGFSLRAQGVVFHVDFDLPHAVAAAAPDGDLALSWADLAPFLDAASPLARGG